MLLLIVLSLSVAAEIVLSERSFEISAKEATFLWTGYIDSVALLDESGMRWKICCLIGYIGVKCYVS